MKSVISPDHSIMELVKAKLSANPNAYYNEQQILKIWDSYIKNKKRLNYWLIEDKTEVLTETLFTNTSSMNILKSAGIIVNDKNTLFINSARCSVSISGPVDYLSNDSEQGGFNGIAHDIGIGLKQIAHWNACKSQKINNHVIIFPYHITAGHWCLGILELKFTYDGTFLTQSQIKIYNPLPQHGGTKVSIEVEQSIKNLLIELFDNASLILENNENNYPTQQKDATSCGVISAENGKDIIDGNGSRISIIYDKGAVKLREDHLIEANCQRFSEMQAKNEYHLLKEFIPPTDMESIRNAWFKVLLLNREFYLTLSNKLISVNDGVEIAKIIRDIFLSNKTLLQSIEVKTGVNIYDALFIQQSAVSLSFRDGTVDILYSLSRGFRFAAPEVQTDARLQQVLKLRLEESGLLKNHVQIFYTKEKSSSNSELSLYKFLKTEKKQYEKAKSNSQKMILILYETEKYQVIGIILDINAQTNSGNYKYKVIAKYYYSNDHNEIAVFYGIKDICAVYNCTGNFVMFQYQDSIFQHEALQFSSILTVENLVAALPNGIPYLFNPYTNPLLIKKHHNKLIGNLVTKTSGEDQIKATKQQIPKNKVLDFLKIILGSEPSRDVLVDIQLDESENDLIILGRPKVIGSSTKQMRHITPYSFVVELIKTKVKDAKSAKDLLNSIRSSLKIFLYHDQGICLSEDEYSNLSTGADYDIKLTTLSRNGNKKTVYYLFNEDSYNISELTAYATKERQKDYQDKKEKFIKFAINYFGYAVGNDENTINIFCEVLSRFILTLFNSKPYTAFPEEGNTLNYEIRLYKSLEHAENPKGKDYTVLTSKDVSERLKESPIADLQIRIVNNEGSIVVATTKALSLLNDILKHITEELPQELEQELIEYSKYLKYINKNRLITVTKNIKSLTEADKKLLILSSIEHVASHLYNVFDFKPLEDLVFVPLSKADLTNIKGIKVFPGVETKKIAVYGIKTGVEHREDQINTAKGYNEHIQFRKEKVDLAILTQKIIEHIIISISPYPYLGYTDQEHKIGNYPIKILENFLLLVVADYNIELKEFEDYLKDGRKLITDIFDNEDHLGDSSESDVEPKESHPYANKNIFLSDLSGLTLIGDVNTSEMG